MGIDSKDESIKGVFYKINKKIEKRITAKYHKIKDWVMDPKGYFLINIDRKNNLLRVGYCKFTKQGNNPVNDMVAEIVGKTAIEIVNTLIKENAMIPDNSFVVGSPGKVIKQVQPEHIERLKYSAQYYVEAGEKYINSLKKI